MSPAERLYRAVLALYPPSFREAHGEEAAELFRELQRRSWREEGPRAAWRRAAAATARALAGAVGEWRQELIRAGGPGGPADPSGRRKMTMGSLIHDARYALRSLRKRPGFALVIVLLLGTGVGATTAVFSLVDGVVLERLPYPSPDRLIYLDNASHSPADFVIWQEEVTSVAAWGGAWRDRADLTGEGAPERVGLGRVTPDFFSVLGGEAALGRTFVPEDFRGEPEVAVLSHDFWQRRWGSDPDVLGREIRLNRRPLTVVGVLAPDFRPEMALGQGLQVWVPYDLHVEEAQDHGLHVLRVIGRLEEGVSLQAARDEMGALDERLAERFPDSHVYRDGTMATAPVLSLREARLAAVEKPLFLLLGAVGLLLLIACANVASLLLARGTERSREMALRGSLGASRADLMAQLGVESLALSLGGGLLGVALAFAGVAPFRALDLQGVPRASEVGVDARVLLFALAASILTGLAFGFLPALQAARTDAAEVLKEGAATSTDSRGRTRLQGMLVVAEVGLSLVLVAGAGLLFHSFLTLTSVDTGLGGEQVVTVELQLMDPYTEEERIAFAEELMGRLRVGVPGARGVVAAPTLPFQYASGGSCCWRSTVTAGEGESAAELSAPLFQPVTPGYFSALGVPLLTGRDLAPGDHAVDPVPAVVSQEVATRLFADGPALGREIQHPGGSFQVVGVVAEVHHAAYEREAMPAIYMPWRWGGARMPFLTLGIRTDAPLAAVAPVIRRSVWELDPNLPVPEILTMENRLSRSVAEERLVFGLVAGFAAVALALAAAGIYATLLYAVRRREREMGIRMALGARRWDVARMILRSGLALTAGGLVLGLAGVWASSRVLESMVFGISPRDPATLALVSAGMIAVALAACLAPALRAGRTDPMETLRME